jgi:hypothetical protein
LLIGGTEDSLDIVGIQSCQHILGIDPETYSRVAKTPEYEQHLPEFLSYFENVSVGSPSIGNVMWFDNKVMLLHYAAQLPFVRTICETGFNAGHSSFAFLTASPHVVVHSFDLGKFRYSRPMAKYLANVFSNRLAVHFGDSNDQVPLFNGQHPDFTCDLMFVDGGHNYVNAVNDLKNFASMANPRKNLIVADDISKHGVREAWADVVHKKIIQEIGCTFKDLPDFREFDFVVGKARDGKEPR